MGALTSTSRCILVICQRLLHENYNVWNIDKVRNLFSEDVAKRILETPLVSSVHEDKVVWEEERNECYSVKSGYKLAMCYIIGNDTYHVAGNWNGIWKAQVPHKTHHLLWRLCRGCLPTRYRNVWNIDKVRNLFSEDVAKRILETPLVSSVHEDKVVWEEERNECYSVKSGYKLAMCYIIGNDTYHVAGNWNGIWKAQVPHKTHHLLWRLCRGCLPTRYRLLERRLECTLNCPVCDEEIEDELHIFFRCAVARDSWCAAGLSSVLHNAAYQQINAMDRIFAVCSNESNDTAGRVTMLLWCIWHNRNDKLWNDNVQMPRQIGRYVFDAWNDWYSVHKLQSNSVSGTTEADLVRWEKPVLGWVKCNVDVAFVSGSGRTSVELCFRDNSCQFMVGKTQWRQTVISSVEGEA
ncbi:hypothetical protein TSUD_393630 [Trifolium subterraneum]|uniref:Reverse transcriptase zinc-binding domain-containing protein n=1 Tax=Trifolium subterraneum TaxID=3900 RepID=A0A2Z6NVD1_TRISU|nr:hypothetical protein TSUD_393630 [Trifolium subterraneum]